jgi:hypothetical protein
MAHSSKLGLLWWMLHILQFTERKQLVGYARGLSNEAVAGAAQGRAAEVGRP